MSALPSSAKASATPAPAAWVPVHVLGSALGAYPGAEVVGVVGELSPSESETTGQSGALAPGQLVLVPRLLPCGECEPCRRGRVSICSQVAARPRRPQAIEHVPPRFLVPLGPPFVSTAPEPSAAYRFAALSDALLAPYSGLVRAGLGPGTLCVVVGHGSRAALAAVVARAMGAATAVVSLGASTDEVTRLQSDPYGAMAVLADESLGPMALRAQLAELALGASLPAHGLCFIETSGSDAGRTLALSLLSAGGSAVFLDRAEPCAPASSSSTAVEHAAPALAMDLPVGPSHSSPALLQRLAHEGCLLIGGGAVHPDLLVELLALCERAHVDLTQLTRPVAENEVDALMTARRCGQGDRLTLPIVAYPVSGLPSFGGAQA